MLINGKTIHRQCLVYLFNEKIYSNKNKQTIIIPINVDERNLLPFIMNQNLCYYFKT